MNAKIDAIKLRKEGYSYSYIAEKTGLSKSTLSYHLAQIAFTPNAFTVQEISRARLRAAETKHAQKNLRHEQAAKEAEKILGRLTKRDLLLLGIGLYLGEGSKTQGLVRLVNTDPGVIQLFIKWLTLFGIDKKQMALRVHVYPDTDISKAEEFWLRVTKLPTSVLQRACVDARGGKSKKRSGIHQFGTAHVTVRAMGKKDDGVQLARVIGKLMQKVLE